MTPRRTTTKAYRSQTTKAKSAKAKRTALRTALRITRADRTFWQMAARLWAEYVSPHRALCGFVMRCAYGQSANTRDLRIRQLATHAPEGKTCGDFWWECDRAGVGHTQRRKVLEALAEGRLGSNREASERER